MINHVTANLPDESVNLWAILDVPPGADQSRIDRAWERSTKTLDQRYAWKALRDPNFQNVYRKFGTIQSLLNAGFFDDGLEIPIENWRVWGLKDVCTPRHKLKFGNTPVLGDEVILVTTGAFSPIHNGHVAMMDEASRRLTEQGMTVMGGYFCPGHDSYVGKKYGGGAAIHGADRVHMAQLALEDTQWMVDPWAALYAPCELNFTDVVRRLRTYIDEYECPGVKIAYVCGEDNRDFRYAFEDSPRELVVVIERTTESSTQVRAGAHDMIHPAVKAYLDSPKPTGVYQIRNDKMGPTHLRNDVIKTLKEMMSHHPVEILELDEQYTKGKDLLGDRPSISIDPLFEGTYNTGFSRIFPLGSPQFSSEAAVTPRDHMTVCHIPIGQYVLIEDDVASGRTLAYAKEYFKSLDIEIVDEVILNSLVTQPCDILDVVDTRDFIIGARFGGLRVFGRDSERKSRAPYLAPFVNLTTRASIPPQQALPLSLALWRLNRNWYGRDIRLSQLDTDFQDFAADLGWSKDTRVVDFCDQYIMILEEALEGRCSTTA